MRQKAHKRSRLIGTSAAAAMVLLLGGGGLAIMNNANAGNANNGEQAQAQWQSSTIDCPEVVDKLQNVPGQARQEVDQNLAQLDSQVAEAYQRLTNVDQSKDANFVNNAIMNPLKDKRQAVIDRISTAIGRFGQQPQGLDGLAECDVKQDEAALGGDQDQNQDGQNQDGQDQNQDGQDQNQDGQDGQNQDGQDQNQDGQDGQDQGQGAQGPSPDDFVDIQDVQPNVNEPQPQGNASTGSFTSDCGVNENGNRNPDNVIVAPGVSNGAHHMHDYVGNQDNDFQATNDSLAAAETSCQNQEDQSSYYWPVMRIQNGQDEQDANAPGGGQDLNVGEIQTAANVELKFEGSPVSDVVEMPRFLRIITGDAKSFTNGDANANASWSCTGFEDRQLTDKYPLCPEGSQVVRTFDFQSCWDGQNIDSANHRTHVAFADEQGNCPNGFQAIPKLVQKVTYDLPADQIFAVDSFPEQLHKPITDHSDFINVMSDNLMQEVVNCINSGQQCNN